MGRYTKSTSNLSHWALLFGHLFDRFKFEFFRKSGRAHNDLLNEYYEAKKYL